MNSIQCEHGKTKLHFGNTQAYALRFKSLKGLTLQNIRDFAKRESDQMHAKGVRGKLYINITCPTGVSKMSPPNQVGAAHIAVFNMDEYDEDDVNRYENKYRYKEFTFYLVKEKREGGLDKHNDCLYNCILQFYGKNKNEIKSRVNAPAKLKKFLDLDRDCPVCVDDLQKLADYMEVIFMVDGDVTYLTTGEHTQMISVTLKEGHFTLQYHKKLNIYNLARKGQSKFVAYRKTNNIYETYDQEAGYHSDIDIENFEDTHCRIEVDEKPEKRHIQEFVRCQKEILAESKGIIDISRCGTYYTSMARLLYNQLQREQIVPDEISQMESEWLSIHGAVMFTKEVENHENESEEIIYEGPARQFDINGQYPYVMCNNTYPVKQPIFKKLQESDVDKFYPYGIYRAKIHRANTDVDRRFRFANENKYTHLDMKLAKRLGLKIDLIQDGGFNAMLYEKDRRTGKDLFSNYMKYLTDLIKKLKFKQSKFIVKRIRNSLWGFLCKRRVFTVKENDDMKIQLDSNFIMTDFNEDKERVRGYVSNFQYSTNYARTCPFITGYARELLNKYLDNCFDSVVRVHTDSLLVIDPDIEFKVSAELGDLKLEHEGNCTVYRKLGCKTIWN